MITPLRPQLKTLLALAAAVMLAATCVVADDTSASDHATFYLESIRPATVKLESVAPQTTDTSTIVVPSTNSYDLSMDGGLMSLRRSFTRTVVDRASALLDIAYQEKSVTEAGLDLGRTALSFSSTTTETKDVVGLSLDSTRVDVMGLKQSFGGGESASSLALTRTITTQELASGEVSTTVDALAFASGLTKRSDLSFKASQLTTDEVGALNQTNLEAVLKLKFAGSENSQSYLLTHKFNDRQDIVIEKMDFNVPLALSGGKGIAEYHSAFTTTDGVEVGKRTTHLLLPFRTGGKAGSLDHQIVGQDSGSGMVETTTTKLVAPFRLAGSDFCTEGTRIVLHKSGSDTETLVQKLTAPLLGGQATLHHQTVKTETSSATTEVEQCAVTLPTIKLGKVASFTGSRTSTDTSGTGTEDVTSVSLTADPLKPLHIEAQYKLDDEGDTQTTISRQLQTKWAICDKTSLVGRFSEAEVASTTTPNVLRLVELVRDRGKSGIGLRAGLASYETSDGTEVDDARRFEVTAGDKRTVAVSAAYSEYDTSSYKRLDDDGTVAVSLQHGDADGFSVRWRYEDKPARVEPLQAVELAMKALGGSLQLSYAANPVAPDGSTVRQADQYEATLGRKILGGVTMEVAYRYLAYDEEGDNDQSVRIKLDGGQEDKSGKLAVAFYTGDYAPTAKSTVTASTIPLTSLLSISYSHKWGAAGRISLTVKQQMAASATLEDDATEGRLELQTSF